MTKVLNMSLESSFVNVKNSNEVGQSKLIPSTISYVEDVDALSILSQGNLKF